MAKKEPHWIDNWKGKDFLAIRTASGKYRFEVAWAINPEDSLIGPLVAIRWLESDSWFAQFVSRDFKLGYLRECGYAF